MGSWLKGLLWNGEGGSNSDSSPPDGITQISDSVFSLSEPREPPEFEIVFLHGLQFSDFRGAYWKTWIAGQKDEDGKDICWPMTWLAKEFPGARILSLWFDCSALETKVFGRADIYSAAECLLLEMVVNANVGQQKNCPVVFVCHCLGGLVAKQMVILANMRFGNNEQYLNFSRNISGFFFYATPHYGSKLPHMVSSLSRTGRMLKQVGVLSNDLFRLNEKFDIERHLSGNIWKFAVVAETLPTKFGKFGSKVVMVEEASAGNGYLNFRPVKADHFGVCKPENQESTSYRALTEFIKVVMGERNLTWVNPEETGEMAVELLDTMRPPLSQTWINAAQQSVSGSDLCEDIEITIFRVGDRAHSTRMLLNMDLKKFLETKKVIQEILTRMEKRLNENKVIIWHKQCEHLLERYRAGVDMIVRALDALIIVEEEGPRTSMNPPLAKFVCSTLIRSMLEGEASLLFCSENENYTKAAFALSTPRHPSVPTFSRFGLVLRELDWSLDFICCIQQHHVDGKNLSFNDWTWCEKRSRLVFNQGCGVMEEKNLEADGRRQTHDREALLTSISSTPNNASLALNMDNQDKLEAILSKRLLTTSQLAGHGTLPDCFWIDNPDSFEHVEYLANGGFKWVDKSKWLGEMVAVGHVRGYPKQYITGEAGLLARVQHPNVVELMACAYKEVDQNDSRGCLATELMEQDLESLIRQQLRSEDGSATTREGPPFPLPVAVDIALQIVEAMVHVRKCDVIHRDLKPNNCLVSPKYRKDSLLGFNDVPMYYTIKLIDFGTSRLRGTQDSYFTTKTGTPCYMAPELFVVPKKPYTWSVDVWSFGMTCYKIFTGKAPFDISIQKEDPGKRPEFSLEFPVLLKELIEKCWAEEPHKRPTIHKVREDLWRCKLYYAWPSNSPTTKSRPGSFVPASNY